MWAEAGCTCKQRWRAQQWPARTAGQRQLGVTVQRSSAAGPRQLRATVQTRYCCIAAAGSAAPSTNSVMSTGSKLPSARRRFEGGRGRSKVVGRQRRKGRAGMDWVNTQVPQPSRAQNAVLGAPAAAQAAAAHPARCCNPGVATRAGTLQARATRRRPCKRSAPRPARRRAAVRTVLFVAHGHHVVVLHLQIRQLPGIFQHGALLLQLQRRGVLRARAFGVG